MVALIGGIYLMLALVIGEMLVFLQTGPGYLLITDSWALAPAHWAYPAVEVVAPGVVLVLPILGTITMLVVSTGVGLGMGAAIVLARGWARERRSRVMSSSGASSMLAGLTPIMLGLLTLGACCSTALAGAAGFGALTRAGTAAGNPLFTNLWALAAFQMVIVWVALVAQEQLFRLYLTVVRDAPPAEPNAPSPSTAPSD